MLHDFLKICTFGIVYRNSVIVYPFLPLIFSNGPTSRVPPSNQCKLVMTFKLIYMERVIPRTNIYEKELFLVAVCFEALPPRIPRLESQQEINTVWD